MKIRLFSSYLPDAGYVIEVTSLQKRLLDILRTDSFRSPRMLAEEMNEDERTISRALYDLDFRNVITNGGVCSRRVGEGYESFISYCLPKTKTYQEER